MPNPQLSPLPGSFQPASDDSITNPSTPMPTQAPSYEWIYPNAEDGKYFTSTQARVYIGNLFIDEIVSLQFAYQGNRIPIYGYSSRKADAFGTGRVLVQGQLAINFVSEGYLYAALNEFNNVMRQNIQPASQGEQIAGMIQAANQLNLKGLQDTANSTSYAALAAQIQLAAAQGGPDAIAAARTSLAPKPSVNAVELDIPFDIRCTLEGAGRTVERTLRNCLLISNEQVYDQSGSVLLDVYGFVGRDSN